MFSDNISYIDSDQYFRGFIKQFLKVIESIDLRSLLYHISYLPYMDTTIQ